MRQALVFSFIALALDVCVGSFVVPPEAKTV